MWHLCVRSLWEGERGIFSNRVCKQTLLIALLSLPAAQRGKKGLVLVSFTSHGERDVFPQGNGQDSNWREESRVRCVMTNAPGAQDLPCRVNKELQNPLGSEPCLTCCSHHQSHTVLKLCQVETLPHFSTLSSSVELEQSMPMLTFYLLSVCGGGYRL